MSVLEQSEVRTSDFVLDEYDQRYTRMAVKIKNNTGVALAAGAIQVGHPLTINGTDYETTNAGGEAAFDMFVIDPRVVEALAIGATTELEYEVLVRGPALVNVDAIPDTDPDGASALDKTALVTAMKAFNPPIIPLYEPETQSTDMWE